MWTLDKHKEYVKLVIRNYKKKQITKDCMRYLVQTSRNLLKLGCEGRIANAFH